ncbi:MAG: hypothetical protein IT260_06485 [Saprospiraceae bacterium]|nr:hypothetical protein [Saprospiraceae bacterium]
MKKILLVCNQTVFPWLPKRIEDQIANGVFKALALRDDHPLDVVSSAEEWNSYRLQGVELAQIFILVELHWDNHSSGFSFATQLFQEELLLDQTLNIQFLSYHNRDTLWEKSPQRYRPFIKSFPLLPFPPENIKPLLFSRRRFRYIRNYCLSKSGQIDLLAHDLKKYLKNDDPAATLLEQLGRVSQLGEQLVGETVFQTASDLIQQLQEAPDSPSNRARVRQQLPLLIQQLEQRRDVLSPTPPGRKKLPYGALIVEDDPRNLKQLEDELGPYFERVLTFTEGWSAKNALLANRQSDEYQALFVDLELLENKHYDQSVTGVDLLDYCEKYDLGIATRIITALPKRGLSELVEKPGKHILYKNHFDSILSGNNNLDLFFKELEQEIKENATKRMRPGPTVGPFAETKSLRHYYFECWDHKRNELLETFREAQDIAEQFVQQMLPDQSIPTEFARIKNFGNNTSDQSLLPQILTHRAIVLRLAAQNGREINYGFFDLTDSGKSGKKLRRTNLHQGFCDHQAFEKPLGNDPKAYFQTKLGFNGRWENIVGSRLIVQIQFKNLFDPERDWLKSLVHDEME